MCRSGLFGNNERNRSKWRERERGKKKGIMKNEKPKKHPLLILDTLAFFSALNLQRLSPH